MPPTTSVRERIARLERPLLLAGLALVTAHLLDLAISGADTAPLGLFAIVALPPAWALAQPRVTRPTRIGVGVTIGLLVAGMGATSHGLHAVNLGPDWRDVTGIGSILGGLALVGAGLTAAAAPRRAPRHRALPLRAAHGLAWAAGAVAFLVFGLMPFGSATMITHAPRWAIQGSSLGIPHEDVRIAASGGRRLSGWYVPSRNGAAVLVSHGSGGSRGRVPGHVRMLARHGYGVLALDNPGNGGSDGHSNGLGDNAQPAIDAGLDFLERRADVEAGRIAGLGLSLGAEVLLEAASHDPRLKAVIADGGARPVDADGAQRAGALQTTMTWLQIQATRGISGMKTSRSLVPMMPRIAPRPVLLVAGRTPGETPTARMYRDAGGPTVQLWELPDSGHTAGLRRHPDGYERRTVSFLDKAL